MSWRIIVNQLFNDYNRRNRCFSFFFKSFNSGKYEFRNDLWISLTDTLQHFVCLFLFIYFLFLIEKVVWIWLDSGKVSFISDGWLVLLCWSAGGNELESCLGHRLWHRFRLRLGTAFARTRFLRVCWLPHERQRWRRSQKIGCRRQIHRSLGYCTIGRYQRCSS